MSDTSQGPGWWLASDGKWYAPHLEPGWSADEPESVFAAASLPSHEAVAAVTAAPAFQAAPLPSSGNWDDDWSVNRAPAVPATGEAATGSLSSADPKKARQRRASKGRSRRTKLMAIVVVVVLIGAGAAVGVSLKHSPSSGLSGKRPGQILQASPTAATTADATQLTESAQSADSTIYVGPNGANISDTGSGTSVGFDVAIVLVNSKIYMKGGGTFWSLLLDSNVSKSPLLAHWIEVPPTNPGVSKLTSGLDMHGLVSSLIALSGPISETSSGSGSAPTVTLQGKLPATPTNLGDGAGDLATLTVSTTAPFYPVGISFQDKQNGSTTISFTSWDKTQGLPSTAGAVSLSSLAATSLKTTTPPNANLSTQSNLASGLTTALAYYLGERRTFAGLDQAAFASRHSRLKIVAGSLPSSSPGEVSLVSSASFVVLAAWSSATRTCWAIVDNKGRTSVDGLSGPVTAYAASVHWSQPTCRASAFSTAKFAASSERSTTGFP
jgi:hypothetical protein